MPSTKYPPTKSLRHHAYSVQYGTQEIAFDLEYSDRKTLGIEVHPNQKVLVKAPIGASITNIQTKVSNRAAWITRQQKQFATYAPVLAAAEYTSGESYRYLGRQYRLQVIKSDRETIKLWAGRLEVYTADIHSSIQIQQQITAWYRDRAQQIFTERYQICVKIAMNFGIHHDQGFELRTMTKRWGSCSNQGQITLNPLLVSAPKDCIDYVILHELCHLKYHNHSTDFYRLLTNLMPDWKTHKNHLNTRIELRSPSLL